MQICWCLKYTVLNDMRRNKPVPSLKGRAMSIKDEYCTEVTISHAIRICVMWELTILERSMFIFNEATLLLLIVHEMGKTSINSLRFVSKMSMVWRKQSLKCNRNVVFHQYLDQNIACRSDGELGFYIWEKQWICVLCISYFTEEEIEPHSVLFWDVSPSLGGSGKVLLIIMLYVKKKKRLFLLAVLTVKVNRRSCEMSWGCFYPPSFFDWYIKIVHFPFAV